MDLCIRAQKYRYLTLLSLFLLQFQSIAEGPCELTAIRNQAYEAFEHDIRQRVEIALNDPHASTRQPILMHPPSEQSVPLTLRPGEPHWGSAIGLEDLNPQGNPFNFFAAGGIETAEFFGFRVDGDTLHVPRARRLQSALDQIHASHPELVAIQFTESPTGKVSSREYLRRFADHGEIPIAAPDATTVNASTDHASLFLHDIGFHTAAVFAPPEVMLHTRKQVGLFLDFLEHLETLDPQGLRPPVTREQWQRNLESISQTLFGDGEDPRTGVTYDIDLGTGNFSIAFERQRSTPSEGRDLMYESGYLVLTDSGASARDFVRSGYLSAIDAELATPMNIIFSNFLKNHVRERLTNSSNSPTQRLLSRLRGDHGRELTTPLSLTQDEYLQAVQRQIEAIQQTVREASSQKLQ